VTLRRLNQTLFCAVQPDIDPRAVCPGGDPYEYVACAIEQAGDRLAAEPELFRRPARRLFQDIRWCFPLVRQAEVWTLVAAWVTQVDAFVESLKQAGYDAAGNPLRCPVFTRRGTPCERPPLPSNGYCPSHQHLAVGDELQVA
jgi:hypothetical protein